MTDNKYMNQDNNLSSVLFSFLGNGSKSILIDGPWGCGKTYSIKEFIKGNKKNNIVYVSLFGIESIDEISINLYKSTQKLKRFFVGASKIIPTFLKVVPNVKDVVEGLENQLTFDFEKEAKKKTIIVFDDLERLSKNISYFDMLGYFNKLFMLDCRIICLISTKALKDEDEKRLNNFNMFKEKIFDNYYLIDQTNEDIYDSIFKKYEIDNIDSIYPLFESNIRQAYKLSFFYGSIIEKIEKKKKEGIEPHHNKFAVLKACLYAILCCLSPKKYKEYDGDDGFGYLDNGIPNETRNTFLHYKENKKYTNDFSIPGFSRLVISLIKAFLFRDYSEFDEIMFKAAVNSPKSILEETYFYLSDADKVKFKEEFSKELFAHNIHWDSKGISLIKTLFEEGYVFTDDMIDIIAKEISGNDIKRTAPYIELQLGVKGRVEVNENEKMFIEKLKARVSDNITNKYINSFDSLYSAHKYDELNLFIEKIGMCDTIEKQGFLDKVVENNFYIPDLTGTINEPIWSYCHSMVLFLEKNDKEKEFIEYARKVCNGSINMSLIDRYHALIYYEMNKGITKQMLVDSSYSISSLFN